MKSYIIGSDEGANWHNQRSSEFAEVGSEVKHELDEDEERALVAAGWLEHKSKGKDK